MTCMDRREALVVARGMWGDLGTISSDEDQPRRVWKIGHFYETIGRGATWEAAIDAARTRTGRRAESARAGPRWTRSGME